MASNGTSFYDRQFAVNFPKHTKFFSGSHLSSKIGILLSINGHVSQVQPLVFPVHLLVLQKWYLDFQKQPLLIQVPPESCWITQKFSKSCPWSCESGRESYRSGHLSSQNGSYFFVATALPGHAMSSWSHILSLRSSYWYSRGCLLSLRIIQHQEVFYIQESAINILQSVISLPEVIYSTFGGDHQYSRDS